MNKEIEKLKKKIVPILKKNNVVRAGIFGSYARGEQKKNSDVDILVKFNGSLLDLVGLEMEIKKILARNVDLLTYKGISPYLKDRILKEEIRII
jgi:uncharacterized protein